MRAEPASSTGLRHLPVRAPRRGEAAARRARASRSSTSAAGEPREETPAFIRAALADGGRGRAVAATRRRRGCPSCARRSPRGSRGASAPTLDPETEVVPTLGSKEAIFSLAQVVGGRATRVAVTTPGYPVPARGALFAGARGGRAAARPRRAAGCRTSTPSTGTRVGAAVAELPEQPDRRRARRSRSTSAAAALAARARLRARLRRGLQGAVVRRRAARVSALQIADRTNVRRLQHAVQALVDARLPLGLRRRRPRRSSPRSSATGPNVGDGAAGVRPARGGRRLGRRGPRRRDPRALRGQARGPAARAARRPACATPAATRRSSCGCACPAAGREASRCGCSTSAASCVAPGAFFGPGGEGYVRARAGADRSPSASAAGARLIVRAVGSWRVTDLTASPRIEDALRAPTATSRDAARPSRRRSALLDRGEVRVAEPDRRRLAGQRVGQEGDPAVLPRSRDGDDRGRPVRVPRQDPAEDAAGPSAACASCRPRPSRHGAYVAPGAVLMPSYVNIGAWVGSGRWSTRGRPSARARRSAPTCTCPAASASAACSSRCRPRP